MTIRTLLTTLTFGLVLVACADEKPAVNPSTPVGGDATSDQAKGNDNADGQLVIAPAIAKLCNIPTAYFAFDSANLGNDGQSALDAVATCFTTGPAKDKAMAIVGHADPRGETEYNFGLGQRRAGTVEKHLAKRGMPEARMETSSRGELEATGSDESSWTKDRKVEIVFAD